MATLGTEEPELKVKLRGATPFRMHPILPTHQTERTDLMKIQSQGKIILAFAAILGATTLFSINVGWAHGDATGVVKERMEAMKSMGEAMKDLAAMVKGEKPVDGQTLSSHSATLKAAASQITKLFPEGSIHGPSEALPLIWKDWERFKDLAAQLEKDAGNLGAASKGDMRSVKIGFAKIGKSCKDCHSDFRKKKAE